MDYYLQSSVLHYGQREGYRKVSYDGKANETTIEMRMPFEARETMHITRAAFEGDEAEQVRDNMLNDGWKEIAQSEFEAFDTWKITKEGEFKLD